ncbi:hypothetical protein DN069_13620 [Streptacidiphilus pinicola]|uniref:N-acetyltransferase domain-containing protein n=1 Tax=Streptacidiphilus pinicola TaxID=2219663 RepID=A0A2X0JBS3_9ACTN|nr:GNAT family protein [Streptacidiphilus pinicola]RAG84998.1 hypothetical protein DN069_13620 [Streptacidiphilus pinicola]
MPDSRTLPRTQPVLHDSRTTLTEFRPGDENAMVEASQDESIRRWTAWPRSYTLTDAQQGIAQRKERFRSDSAVAFAIRRTGSDLLVGGCDLRTTQDSPHRFELAYWLAGHARGAGVASSAVRLVCQWAFRELPALRIEALVQPENTSSRAVLLRASFTHEGTLRAFRIRRGLPIDLDCYALLKNE